METTEFKLRGFCGRDKELSREDIKRCVGSGWSDIIDRLIDDLEKLGWNGRVAQVKEKFGELRFYIDEGTDSMFDRIEKATTESLRTCEDCGAPGEIRGGGWLRTLCDNCDMLRRLNG